MKRLLMLALIALPLAVSLGGCIIYEGGHGGGYYHPYYWHDHDRW